MPTQRPPHACADWGGCPMPAGFLQQVPIRGCLWAYATKTYITSANCEISGQQPTQLYIYILYGRLRWSFKNETTHLGWMKSMKQFGILSRNPEAVRTSRRITAETFQRCSMSCRFEKLCRYRTIVSYVSYGLINWKIHKKHKMVDELKVFWPGNVWNLHDLWQASLTNDGHAQTISCPGHVGRTSPWRASCPRQSWNLRRRPHSIM